MKKQVIKRVLAVFLIMICLGTSGVKVKASEEEIVLPIYLLAAVERGGEEGFVCQCFVVTDGENQWMLSTEMLEHFSTEEYAYGVYFDGDVRDVVPAWTGNHVTVLYSPERIDSPAFWLSQETVVENGHGYITIDQIDTDTMEVEYGAEEFDLRDLRKIGKFYCVAEDEGLDDLQFGAPVLDVETIEAVGVMGLRGEGAGFYEISGISLPRELAMENWGEEEVPEVDEEALAAEEAAKEEEPVEEIPEEQPQEEVAEVPVEAETEEIPVEQQPEEEQIPTAEPVIVPEQPVSEDDKDNNNGLYIGIGAGLVGALVAAPFGKKAVKSSKLKKQTEGKTVPADQKLKDVPDGSISLEPIADNDALSSIAEKPENYPTSEWEFPGNETIPLESEVAATEKQTPIQIPSVNGNIIKGLSGHLAGVRMQIGKGITAGRDSRTCELCFPQDAKGISGAHFSVSEDGEDIIIRDLNSSYGTFFENGERLMPDVAYRVPAGTMIYLAHGEDSFWVGKEEDEMNTHYQFAVKALAGELKDRTYYMARGGRMHFGRGEGCQVLFSSVSKGVSGNHCEIRWIDGKVVLVDSGSTNGTFFSNGMRLKPGVAYELEVGVQFYLTDERNTFQVIECR